MASEPATRRVFRRGLRIAAWSLAGLVALVIVMATAARIYVATARGQAAILRRLEREVHARSDLRLHVDALAGSLVSGARLLGVRLADADGRPLMRAERMDLSWDPISILARRPHLSIAIPSSQLWPSEAKLELSLPKLKGGSVDVQVRNARVELGGSSRPLSVADLKARLELGDRSGRATVSNVNAIVATPRGPRAIDGTIEVAWRDGAFDLTRAILRAGKSHAAAHGSYRDGVADLRLDTVTLSPDDLHAALPARLQPLRPIQARGSLRGPLRALVVSFDADTGAGTLRLRGTVDVTARRADGAFELAALQTDFLPAAEIMIVSGRGKLQLVDRRLTLDLDARYQHRTPPPDLAGVLKGRAARRFALATPGGRLHASLSAQLGNGVEATFQARLSEPGGVTRLLDDGQTVTRSDLLVRGRFVEHPHAAPVLKVRARSVPRRPLASGTHGPGV